MGETPIDEISPLLRNDRDNRGNMQRKPRLPYMQLAVLAICRICDPISMMSIFAYLPQMIRSFGVTEEDIGVWAGLIGASFAISQSLTGVAWGWSSNKLGRKPVILSGLAIMVICTIIFGFSTNIKMLIIARCCVGLLSGNIGVIRTVVAELVPEKELQPRAFGFLPLAWNLGCISGPALGGLLSEPADKYPLLFPKRGFFDKHPWALPNIVIAGIILIAFLLGILFLDETLDGVKYRYDPGREMGKTIEGKVTALFGSGAAVETDCDEVYSRRHRLRDSDTTITDEENPLLPDRCDSSTVGSSSGSLKTSSSSSSLASSSGIAKKETLLWFEILNPQSICAITLSFLIALHRVACEQLLSLFLAIKPRFDDPIRLPFHIPGGFGLSTSQIGLVFTAAAIIEIFVQFFVYPRMARIWSNKKLLGMTAITDPIVYLLIPYTRALDVNSWSVYAAWGGLLLMISFNSVLGVTSSVLLVSNSASSPKALGMLNGFATSAAGLGVGIGPTVFGYLFSLGQKMEWTTVPWIGLVIAALLMQIWIPRLKG